MPVISNRYSWPSQQIIAAIVDQIQLMMTTGTLTASSSTSATFTDGTVTWEIEGTGLTFSGTGPNGLTGGTVTSFSATQVADPTRSMDVSALSLDGATLNSFALEEIAGTDIAAFETYLGPMGWVIDALSSDMQMYPIHVDPQNISADGVQIMLDGNDSIRVSNVPDGVNLDFGDGNDSILIDADTYARDELRMGRGNDYAFGGGGHDVIRMGAGDDTARGGYGNDTLYGWDGNDFLWGQGGNDHIFGGDGNDTIWANSGTSRDTVHAGAGDDLVTLGGHSLVFLGDGIDRTRSNNDLDPDTVYGEAGDDSIETYTGNDLVGGGTGNDTLRLWAGDDTGTGYTGNDSIIGGDGNDQLWGGAGDDTITGDDGNDTVKGGNGQDTIDGGAGADHIFGGNGVDKILGGSGDDLIDGGGSSDNLAGGTGDDTIFGGYGFDLLHGAEGNDSLRGGSGNDTLYGDPGEDTLLGDAGDDLLIGGADADRFEFSISDGTDTVTDYDTLEDSFVLLGSGVSSTAQVGDDLLVSYGAATETDSVLLLGVLEADFLAGDVTLF